MRTVFDEINTPESALQTHHRPSINLVEKMQAATLIVARKSNHIVGFQQTKIFLAKALIESTDSLTFKNKGHAINEWQSKVKQARRFEDFLAKRLGGRSGDRGWLGPGEVYLGK